MSCNDRSATATCSLFMEPETARQISDQELSKGDVLGVARIAAIQGAKRAAELVPMADEALLGAISVEFEVKTDQVLVSVSVRSRDGGPVDMAALTACSVAALTIYDMCKAVDRSMHMDGLRLLPGCGS